MNGTAGKVYLGESGHNSRSPAFIRKALPENQCALKYVTVASFSLFLLDLVAYVFGLRRWTKCHGSNSGVNSRRIQVAVYPTILVAYAL